MTRTRTSRANGRWVAAVATVALLAPVMSVTGAQPVPAGDMELTSIDMGEGGGRELPAMSESGDRVVLVGRGEFQGVWLRDRAAGVSYRLTTGSHFNPAISADGNTVAYVEYGGKRPIYVMDITDPSDPGTPVLVSKSAAGVAADALSDFPALSGDGRFVAFHSMASNLDPATPPAASGGPNKVYLHDRDASDDGTFDETGDLTTVMLSTLGSSTPGGNAVKPDITPDGAFVVFASEQVLVVPAVSLAAEEEEEVTATQIYKLEVATGELTLVSHAPDGTTPGDLGSALEYGPTVSDDGGVVAFESDATNLVAGDTNGDRDAFVEAGGVVTRASVDIAAAQVDLEPQPLVPCTGLEWRDETGAVVVPIPLVGAGPQVSGDGTYVAFESQAALTPDDLNDTLAEFGTVRMPDIYGYDVAGGTVERLSQPLPEGLEATGCRTEGHTGTTAPMSNGVDPTIGLDRSHVSFVSSGDLAAERPVPVVEVTAAAEDEEEGTSTESAIHTRTYGPLGTGAFVRDTVAFETDVNTTVPVLVALTQAATEQITVDYTTVDGTALAGQDYTATAGTLTFEVGEIATYVDVTVLGDNVVETDKSFGMALSNGSVPVGDPLATIVIIDEDVAEPLQQHYLTLDHNGTAEVGFSYGRPGDTVVYGDWNGDGTDTIGVRRGATWYLRNSNTAGAPDLVFVYGSASDEPIVGDWNADGTDTVGVRRGATLYLRNSNTAGSADIAYVYGLSTDTLVVGDWDGNGQDTMGVRRGRQFMLRNLQSGGAATLVFSYGQPTDLALNGGDWDGDGDDTVGVWRSRSFLLRNSNTAGAADISYAFGTPTDRPHVGDWDGNDQDTAGVSRTS
jgi:hypothetical protein